MYKQIGTAIAVLLLLYCCNSDEKDAQKRLDEARALYESQQFTAAKNVIDSVHVLYPRQIAARREALTLMRLVEKGECERNIAYIDSLLPVRIHESDALKKGFFFKKDATYDVIGNYIPNAMTVERNIERSYIRCGVNEEGEMYVASVYFGSGALNHTGLTFSANDGTFAASPAIPYDGGVNYRFKDLGNTTEVVTYKGEKCKELANYIWIVNEKERIKATYTGGKPFSLFLSDADKKAIKATYELAYVLNEITMMRKDKTKMEMKIMLLDEKISKTE
jgi:hypothetical protein